MPTEHKLLTKAYFFVSLHLQSASQTGSHPTTAPRKPIVAAHQPQQSVYINRNFRHISRKLRLFFSLREKQERRMAITKDGYQRPLPQPLSGLVWRKWESKSCLSSSMDRQISPCISSQTRMTLRPASWMLS